MDVIIRGALRQGGCAKTGGGGALDRSESKKRFLVDTSLKKRNYKKKITIAKMKKLHHVM